ncbi:LLM class flavin-dependent oxidoreductase [Sphingomonas adhaesiva]|uniref:LLM class flavin-dependent oxidoreductase n=1 Tax=Sphingomonas adhaesiva TaxID=28212 RepID=UPI002FFB96E9
MPAARACDVFLMWPDKKENVAAIIADMKDRAATYGRELKLRLSRARQSSARRRPRARTYGRPAVVEADAQQGAEIRAKSARFDLGRGRGAGGAARECGGRRLCPRRILWTGVGRARSGCGAAIVGDPDQVLAKLEMYREMGIDAFILSGYPHAAEADLFARHVLPNIDHAPL